MYYLCVGKHGDNAILVIVTNVYKAVKDYYAWFVAITIT